MKLPDKNSLYRNKEDGQLWEIWSGEDFSSDILLYNTETGEDGSWPKETFWKYFEKLD